MRQRSWLNKTTDRHRLSSLFVALHYALSLMASKPLIMSASTGCWCSRAVASLTPFRHILRTLCQGCSCAVHIKAHVPTNSASLGQPVALHYDGVRHGASGIAFGHAGFDLAAQHQVIQRFVRGCGVRQLVGQCMQLLLERLRVGIGQGAGPSRLRAFNTALECLERIRK